MILDTSGLLAALDSRSSRHADAQRALETAEEPLVLSPFVLAELDYLVTARVGASASRDLLEDVGRAAYELAVIESGDVSRAASVIDRYADLEIGLTDASIVVLADRYGTDRVLTLDERHFRTLRTLAGRPFTLLPADA